MCNRHGWRSRVRAVLSSDAVPVTANSMRLLRARPSLCTPRYSALLFPEVQLCVTVMGGGPGYVLCCQATPYP